MLIHPEWRVSPRVHAAMTTRIGGVSPPPFGELNLGYSTADLRDNVIENERRTAQALGVDTEAIRWVYQVHGNEVRHAESLPVNAPLGGTEIQADAIVSRTPGLVCGVKIADCMPVLLAARDGSVVAAAHAGWRGLASGVVENTLRTMGVTGERVTAWLGPCIGPKAFEVGEDVRAAFVSQDSDAAAHFYALPKLPNSDTVPSPPKFLCDLAAIARQRLAALGVAEVVSSDACTYSEPERFFSHRRDHTTGRMAAFVWIE